MPEMTADGLLRRVPRSVRVPKGATDGLRLRVPGKGLPRPDGKTPDGKTSGHAGDLFCVLGIVTPTVPGEREKELYKELANVSGFDPRGHFS